MALSTSFRYTCRQKIKLAECECTWCQYHMLGEIAVYCVRSLDSVILCSFLSSCKFGILFHIAFHVVYPICYCAWVTFTVLIYLVYCTTMHNAMTSFNVCLVAVLWCTLLWCPSPCQGTCFVIVNLQSQLYCYSVRTSPTYFPPDCNVVGSIVLEYKLCQSTMKSCHFCYE